MNRTLIILAVLLASAFGASESLPAAMTKPLKAKPVKSVANWAQWRGPDSQGISPETGLPTVWSATQNVKWKTAIPGRGHSSPIVWGDRVFLTTSLEGEIIPGAKAVKHKLGGEDYVHPDSVGADRQYTLQVICLDRRSGNLLWRQTAYEGRVYDDRHRKATYADGTPATDGRFVYAWFGSEGLYCYDFNGKLIWKKSLGNIATQGMGNGTSPLLYENMVILQCDEDNGEKSFIAALDKRSGRELWRAPRQVEVSWTTPVIARTPARTELVASGNQFIVSYDPATGEELWRCQGTQSWTAPTPLVGHGIVVVSAMHPVKRALAIRLGGSGDLIGEIDLYQVTHHGGNINNDHALLRSLRPTVAVMINGPRKGGHPDTVKWLSETPSFKALYQLHRNVQTTAEQNAPDEFIANLDEQPDDAHMIMVSVDAAKRAFTVTNGRTKESRSYQFK